MKRLLPVLLLTACTTYPDYMAEWIDRPAEDLLSQWGAPDSRIQIDGKQVWTWIERSIKTHRFSGTSSIVTCRRSFVVNNGTVEDWSRRNCDRGGIQLGRHPLAPEK